MSLVHTTLLLGFALFIGVLLLVRRGQLHGRSAVRWIVLALGGLVVGAWPGLLDRIGEWFGIAYPPMLLAFVVLIVVLLKVLALDILASRREVELRRLSQRLAMLELELQELRGMAAPLPDVSKDGLPRKL